MKSTPFSRNPFHRRGNRRVGRIWFPMSSTHRALPLSLEGEMGAQRGKRDWHQSGQPQQRAPGLQPEVAGSECIFLEELMNRCVGVVMENRSRPEVPAGSRSYLAHIRIPSWNKADPECAAGTSAGGAWSNGDTRSHSLLKCRTVQLLWKIVCQVFTKLNMLLPYNLVITLGVHSDEARLISPQKAAQEVFQQFSSLSPHPKQPRCPLTGEWIKELWSSREWAVIAEALSAACLNLECPV